MSKFQLTLIGIVGLLAASMGGCPSTNSDQVSVIPGNTGSNPSNTGSSGNNGGSSPGTTGSTDSSGTTTTAGTSTSTGQTTDNSTSSGCITPTTSAASVNEILDLVNAERALEGLSPLTLNATLAKQAGDYACEMIEFDFFAHENPVTGSDLVSRTTDAGYRYRLVGENLAAGQRTAADAMNGWMNSPGHRANILRDGYEEIGIAVRQGGDYGIYWVQVFGSPL